MLVVKTGGFAVPSQCSLHALAVGTSRFRNRNHAQQANCRTPTVSLPTPTTSAKRLRRFPVRRRGNRVPHSHRAGHQRSRPPIEPTPAQEPTATRSATKNPSRSPIPVETITTQTVTAAPSPSTVTRSVTISASPKCQARRRPRPRRASLPKQTEFPGFGGRWRVTACSRDSDATLRADTPSTSLEGGFAQRPSKRWRGLPACLSLSLVNRALLIRSRAAGPSARIA